MNKTFNARGTTLWYSMSLSYVAGTLDANRVPGLRRLVGCLQRANTAASLDAILKVRDTTEIYVRLLTGRFQSRKYV